MWVRMMTDTNKLQSTHTELFINLRDKAENEKNTAHMAN